MKTGANSRWAFHPGEISERFLLVAICLGMCNWPAGAILDPLRGGMAVRFPSVQERSLQIQVGRGVALALLGGFRGLAADCVWLEANRRWEDRDGAGTLAALRMVADIDPRPVGFWIAGARMMAFDMAAWRGGGGDVEAGQARLAVGWLDEALRHHPHSARLHVERAAILLSRLRDWEGAAAGFRRAAELPDSPWYAARVHAALLCRLGRRDEALAWLVRLHPGLPTSVAAAQSGIVLSRIRELEDELGVPAESRYVPAGSARDAPRTATAPAAYRS